MHDARLAARPSNGNGRVQHTHTQTHKALHHSCTQKPIEKNSGRFLHDKNRSVHRKDRQKSEHFRKIGASGSPALPKLRVINVILTLYRRQYQTEYPLSRLYRSGRYSPVLTAVLGLYYMHITLYVKDTLYVHMHTCTSMKCIVFSLLEALSVYFLN